MTNPKLLAGDIFVSDSDKIGAKIVKFLMISPTIWHWLFGIRDEVRFFHPGIVIDQYRVIEQQSKVLIRSTERCIFSKSHIVLRNKSLTDKQRNFIVTLAKQDLGEGYDILLIFGKLFTWLTGIKVFTRWIQQKEKEICVTRVAKWYYRATGITFGKKTWHEVTTDDIDDYCTIYDIGNWEIISTNYVYKPKYKI